MFARKGEADMRMRDRESFTIVDDGLRFRAVALESRRAGVAANRSVTSIRVPVGRRRGGPRPSRRPRPRCVEAVGRHFQVRVVIARRATAPMDGSASPGNQACGSQTGRRQGSSRWRVVRLRVRDLRGMPSPSSTKRRSFRPPASMAISIVRSGVDRIFDQFLHDRSRTLDDFAGGNAVDQDGIEAADIHRRVRSRESAEETRHLEPPRRSQMPQTLSS